MAGGKPRNLKVMRTRSHGVEIDWWKGLECKIKEFILIYNHFPCYILFIERETTHHGKAIRTRTNGIGTDFQGRL